MMSSAHIRQHGWVVSVFALFCTESNISGRSDRNILKRSGLNMQPCLTPWFIGKTSVTLFFILTQAVSFIYIFYSIKKIPFYVVV